MRDLLAFCAYLSRSVSESSSIVVTVITNHPPTSNPMQILLDSMVAGGLKGKLKENREKSAYEMNHHRIYFSFLRGGSGEYPPFQQSVEKLPQKGCLKG